jgi:hypothetical protein
MPITTRYLALLGLAIFVYIISRVGYETVIDKILAIDPGFVVLVLVVVAVNVILKSYKWRMIIKAHGADYSLGCSVKVFLIGMFTGLLTPGRVGDFIRAMYLSRNGVPLGRSVSTIIIDRLLDILSLMTLFFLAVLWLTNLFGGFQISIPLALFFLGGVTLGTYFLLKRDLIKKTMRPLYLHLLPEKYKSTLRDGFEEFYDSIEGINRKGMVLPALLAVASWLITGLEGYLIAHSLGINISYLLMTSYIPIISLVELLPISISGLGTREVAVISLFTLAGIGAESAVSFSILYLVLGYWAAALIGGILWLRAPLDIRASSKV